MEQPNKIKEKRLCYFEHLLISIVNIPTGCSLQLKRLLEKQSLREDLWRPIFPNLPFSPYNSPYDTLR